LKLKSPTCFHKAVIVGHPTIKQLCAISDKTYISKPGRNKPSNADLIRRKAGEQFRCYLLGINPASAAATQGLRL
jgi:hypothetical protein